MGQSMLSNCFYNLVKVCQGLEKHHWCELVNMAQVTLIHTNLFGDDHVRQECPVNGLMCTAYGVCTVNGLMCTVNGLMCTVNGPVMCYSIWSAKHNNSDSFPRSLIRP